MPERRKLRYDSAADVIGDIERLRAGACDRCGNWTLAQACWHLNTAMSFQLQGHKTPDTPEQLAAKERVKQVLAIGMLPSGVKAPDRITPPADVPDSAVDDFIATLRKFESFKGPFSTHRLFGNLADDEMRRLNLIHAAHHLSHFVPCEQAKS
jgi:hypothetical protein